MQVFINTCIFYANPGGLKKMKSEADDLVKKALEELITPNKLRHINYALQHRTRHLVVALENIHKPHNASAVLRTIECLGIQEYYIIESQKQYRISPHVAKGAGKWTDIYRFNSREGKDTLACIQELRTKGYKIAVTSPRAGGYSPETLPLENKLAIFFGNELSGLSNEALSAADMHIHVPMWGFTESYNLSVSASILFYTLLNRLRSSKISWLLTEEERDKLRMQWYRKIITRADIIEKEVIKNLIHG